MKAALFDLDGVIVDTEPSYSIFWGAMGRDYNVCIDNFADVIKGTTLTQILERYFPEEVRGEVVEKLNQYEREMRYEIFPEVRDYLEGLRSRGVKCAIVTSSNLEKMDNLWKQQPWLMEYFDVVITDEDVTLSKPDPQPYLIAAERLGIAPEDCVVYEDSYNGLLSGRRAGCRVVALATTNPRASLEDKADIVVYNLSQLSE